ncbi:hypothetical protein [Parendozoicomonas haliclonae]|uniref:Alpha/beta hydrolase family protein n=1 Tax=Parendozoicomonas haliclonae TaxID=1960125 RepID=A0A1X7AIV1_9GAMM|nr:hypothetical protein [Parendozoicomonas haliclonae]SMA44791.1 hypothetical protein EHSB41UT_01797 [Parendozoicomonas haliclonae]
MAKSKREPWYWLGIVGLGFSLAYAGHTRAETEEGIDTESYYKERVKLVLNNLSGYEAERLTPYLEELARQLQQSCGALPCQPGELSIEQAVSAIKVWQRIHLDGFALQPESAAQANTNSIDNGPMLPGTRDECAGISDGEISMEYGFFKERKVQVFINKKEAASKQGPVVFYWHGSNENWEQVYRVLGSSIIRRITSQGGIIFAPHAGAPVALPWHVMNPATVWKHNDFQLADQLLACAEKQYDIDNRRIYSMGFSAGGLQSAAMGRLRSNYIAAIASYSGGQLPWYKALPLGAKNNYYSAYITYGTRGEDKVPLVEFADTSANLLSYLKGRGFHEVIECEQSRGHSMPYSTMSAGWDFISKQRYERLSDAEAKKKQPADVQKKSGSGCN